MPASREDWERVGALLIDRRIEISPRYANRRAFAAETGLNWRTLYDAEHGKRATFKPQTVRAFEAAYRLVPGSLVRALAGGGLEPLSERAGPALAAAPPPGPCSREEELLDHYLDRYRDDPAVRALADQPGRPAALRLADVLMYATARYGPAAAGLPGEGDGVADGTGGRLPPPGRRR